MLNNLNGWHLVIILVVILLLFGATRLPALSKSLGQSMRIFRSETKAMKDDVAAEKAAEPAAPAPAASVPPAAAPVVPAPPVAEPASNTAVAPESNSEPKS